MNKYKIRFTKKTTGFAYVKAIDIKTAIEKLVANDIDFNDYEIIDIALETGEVTKEENV